MGETEQQSVPASEGPSPGDQAKLGGLRGAVEEAQDEFDRGGEELLDSADELDALLGIKRGLADLEAGRVTPLERFEREFRESRGLRGGSRR